MVKSMEARYCEVVSNAVLSSRVRMQIVTQLRDLPSMHYLIHRDVCKCNLVCPIVNLFVTMRLHHTLMMNSRYFPTCKTGRNRKCLKFSHVWNECLNGVRSTSSDVLFLFEKCELTARWTTQKCETQPQFIIIVVYFTKINVMFYCDQGLGWKVTNFHYI